MSDKLCAGVPMDQCACKCYHEAQWTCEGSSVVCKAKFGVGELKTVGDKVSEFSVLPMIKSRTENCFRPLAKRTIACIFLSGKVLSKQNSV